MFFVILMYDDERGPIPVSVKRWKTVWVVKLSEFHLPIGKNLTLPPVRIGDVIVHDQGTSQRAFWKLAKIRDLIKGRDGKVHGA